MPNENQGRKIDGLKMAVDMLNKLEKPLREKLLSQIAKKDPDTAKRINDRLFTFEDLIQLGERTIQDLLKQIPSKKLALALRNASASLKAHLYKSMPKRAADILREESENMGPQKLSEVSSAQDEIAAVAKKMLKE